MTSAPAQTVSTPQPAALRSASPQPVTLLRVFGEDAFSYLQSQVSADLRVSGERWLRYALWLDASGHVLADSFILREGAESFLLFSYGTPADRLEEIVLSNVIADDVEVAHLGDRYQHWALWAQGAEGGCLPQALLPDSGCFTQPDLADAAQPASAPQSPAAQLLATQAPISQSPTLSSPAAAVSSGGSAPALPALLFGGRNTLGENYDLLIPVGAALPSAVAALREVSWAERQARRIADGIPAVPADIGAGDLPQEGGDLARVAVSTSKGCYLGQEVIARWQATGQVRSALFRVRLLAGKTLASAPCESASRQGQTHCSGETIEADTIGADAGSHHDGIHSATDSSPHSGVCPALPLRLYAGTKPVGELRSFAPENGAGLALLRIHRLGDVRALAVGIGGEAVLEVMEPQLS